MDELYKKYGQLMIQLEILNGEIKETKRAIAEGLQKGAKESPKPELVQGT